MRPSTALATLWLLSLHGCSSSGSGSSSPDGTGAAGASGAGGSASSAGGSATGTGGSAPGGGPGASAFDQAKTWIDAYKLLHPGNGGKDWDINARTASEISADPAAAQLLSLCSTDERPVIPALAWEYGGGDHPWINPDASALVYCVAIPVSTPTAAWSYDAGADHVTADVRVLFPDQNPCKSQTGADQVAACIGDPTNFEILVDTASLNDGADAGLSLSTASTELRLVLPDGTKVHLADNA